MDIQRKLINKIQGRPFKVVRSYPGPKEGDVGIVNGYFIDRDNETGNPGPFVSVSYPVSMLKEEIEEDVILDQIDKLKNSTLTEAENALLSLCASLLVEIRQLRTDLVQLDRDTGNARRQTARI